MVPKISVIIPVYNGERYIDRCIKNVFMQTYKDWELILVNDGSNDGTKDYLDVDLSQVISEYSINNNINVLHKSNGGVSSARNLGIENAKGEYIAFIDVDDIIEPTYIEHLCNGIGYDMIVNGFCYDNNPQVPSITTTKTKAETAKKLDEVLNTDYFCFPWARLFKTSIIKEYNISFDTNMRFGEDHVFNWTYMCHINSIYIGNDTDYHKMSDDGHDGYNLSYDEMDYVDCSLFGLKNKLEDYFNVEIHPAAKTFCHVLFMKDYLIAYPCSFYANYYKKYHPTANKHEIYDYIAKNIYHPGLQLMKQGKYTNKQLKDFLDEPWKLFLYTNIKSRIYIPIIKFT